MEVGHLNLNFPCTTCLDRLTWVDLEQHSIISDRAFWFLSELVVQSCFCPLSFIVQSLLDTAYWICKLGIWNSFLSLRIGLLVLVKLLAVAYLNVLSPLECFEVISIVFVLLAYSVVLIAFSLLKYKLLICLHHRFQCNL